MERKNAKFIGMVGLAILCVMLLSVGSAMAQQKAPKYHLKVGSVELADAANTKGF